MIKLFVFFINSSLYIFTFVLYMNIALKFIISSPLTIIFYITQSFSLLLSLNCSLTLSFSFQSGSRIKLTHKK